MKNQKFTHYTNHLQNGSFDSSNFADPRNNGPTNIDDTDIDSVEWTDLLGKIMNLTTSSSVGQMLDAIQDILETYGHQRAAAPVHAIVQLVFCKGQDIRGQRLPRKNRLPWHFS